MSGARTTAHTWVDVELRVIGQHVAVNIKNPNRSWVHNLGPQQKSTFLLWTGVLKCGLGSIRGVMLGHLDRTKILGLPEQFGVVRLLEDVVELVYVGYPLSVIRSLVRSLPCSRVAQIGRKTVRTWISLCKNRMVLDDEKDQRQKPRHGGSGARRGRSGGRRDSGWRSRCRGSARKSRSSSSSSSSSSQSRRTRRGKQQRVKEAQKLLEKHDLQYQQWQGEAKKKESAVELQEQAEVLAKVVKEQFDQTMSALSPSLTTPPQFPPSPRVVPNLILVAEERRGQNDLLEAPQLR